MSLDSIVSTLFGGLISGLLGWWFYYRSGQQLAAEAARLRLANNIILRALHNAGLAEVNFNAAGEPTGLIVKASGFAAGRSTATGILTVGPPAPPPVYDRQHEQPDAGPE